MSTTILHPTGVATAPAQHAKSTDGVEPVPSFRSFTSDDILYLAFGVMVCAMLALIVSDELVMRCLRLAAVLAVPFVLVAGSERRWALGAAGGKRSGEV